MNILITGGTGFIGSALCRRLLKQDHDVIVLSRHPENVKFPLRAITDLSQLDDEMIFDVVINLAGEPIADKRWSEKQKQHIMQSRMNVTQQLITYFEALKHKPDLFISGSAIGFYGTGISNELFDESALGDHSFSSQLCQQWEYMALQAEQLGIRTCFLRTGIVLGKQGVLAKMLWPFKLGLGGKIASGRQWMSWIHLEDLLGIILFCIKHPDVEGIINGTSPSPVSNQVFSQTLADVLHRPSFFPMPAFVIKMLMGQMGEELLLTGKKVIPAKISAAGYQFKFTELKPALLDLV